MISEYAVTFFIGAMMPLYWYLFVPVFFGVVSGFLFKSYRSDIALNGYTLTPRAERCYRFAFLITLLLGPLLHLLMIGLAWLFINPAYVDYYIPQIYELTRSLGWPFGFIAGVLLWSVCRQIIVVRKSAQPKIARQMPQEPEPVHLPYSAPPVIEPASRAVTGAAESVQVDAPVQRKRPLPFELKFKDD